MVNLFIKAMNSGGERLSISSMRWNISGNCTDPYWTSFVGRPRSGDPWRPDKYFVFSGKRMTLYLDIGTRCRKCDRCKKARMLLWRHRCREEVRLAARSWFGTLTMGPAEQHRMLEVARHQAHSTSVPWNTLSEEQRFLRVANASLKEVTKYIKRFRKEAAVPFRYIVVTEQHKSGLPHFHMLVHETTLKPVRHATLSKQWNLGFEKWRLVPLDNPKSAEYVVKYLAKSSLTRVRASQDYGRSEQAGIVGPLLASFRSLNDINQ